MKGKPKMSWAAVSTLKKIRDYHLALLDGKQHGAVGGCSTPLPDGEGAHYIRSWVLPRLDALIDYGEGKASLPGWAAE
jgi:hypothetical protein